MALLFALLLPAAGSLTGTAQDSDVTLELTVEANAIFLATETAFMPVPTETATLAVAATEPATETLTPGQEATALITVEMTSGEVTDAVMPLASETALLPDFTPAVEVEPDLTLTPAPVPVETSPAALPALPGIIPSDTPRPVRQLAGLAHYQNRLPDDAGILVTVRDLAGSVMSQATTDARGIYTISVPTDTGYWLHLAASRHLALEILLTSATLPPEVWLAGGDLNADGCINQPDINLMRTAFSLSVPTADINQDGVMSAVDIAILTGNYQPECVPVTPAPMLVTPQWTVSAAEITLEVTEAATQSPEATPEAGNGE